MKRKTHIVLPVSCHPKIIIFQLPTWAMLGRRECQKRFNLEGKGYGLKFPDFFQNVVIVNRHLKLRLAELINHSYCSLWVTRTFAAAFGRLFFSTSKKKKQKLTKKHYYYLIAILIAFESSFNGSLLIFGLCIPWGEKKTKWFSLCRVKQFQHKWKKLLSQKLQWNRLEYYVNQLFM